MRKKALWSVEFLFKVIFAVIISLILIYAAGRFFSILKDVPKKEQAKAQFDAITAIISELKENEVRGHMIFNPTDWTLLYFSGSNSLCFCYSAQDTLLGWRIAEKWIWTKETEDFWKETCDSIGVCQPYKIDFDIRFLAFNGGKPEIDRIWGLRISKAWDFYISKENGNIVFRLFDKSDYEQLMTDVINVVSQKLSYEETNVRVEAIRSKAEKERNMPIIVIIEDKTAGTRKFLPSLERATNIAVEKGDNFVFSRDTEDKTKAVYLVFGAKNG